MKLSFRVTLVTAMLTLLTLAMVLQGVNSHHNGVYTIDDLSQQLFEQTSKRIEREIEVRLSAASRQSNLTRRLITTGTMRIDEFPQLVSQWRIYLEQNPTQSGIFMALASGAFIGLSRVPDELFVLEAHRDPKTGKLNFQRFRPDDYPQNPMPLPGAEATLDPRQRPWYKAAARVGHSTWTEPYVLRGVGLPDDVHGVSYATPFHDMAGNINAVMESSFELSSLCHFLTLVKVADHGYAFIIYQRLDGSRFVIAHPQNDIILRPRPDRKFSEFVPIEEFADPVARAYAHHLKQHPDEPAAQPTIFHVNGVPYIGVHQQLQKSVRFPHNWTICVVVPRSDILGRIDQNYDFALWLAGGIFLLVLFMGYTISTQVAKPLERLGKETVAIGDFRIEPQPVAHSFIVEVDRLAVAVEDMKTSLRSFQKYVPADLVREMLRGNQEASLGGERRVLTLCFCDLRDSTTIAESMAPEAFVEQLREYLGSLSEAIVESAGTVDKFIGDAVMAFWGAPTPLEDHALCACRAALRCQQRMRELRKLWEARGLLPFHTRIGINSGEVVVGNIGSVTRLNYTAIGDPVNLAARLEGVNKVYGTEIIISAHTRRMAGDAVIVRPLGGILVKGKTEAVQIYELLGLKGECDEAQFAWAAIHAEGVDEYGKRHWRAAIERFERVLALKPGDGAAKFMIEQCRRYEAEPPPEDWSALYRSDVH